MCVTTLLLTASFKTGYSHRLCFPGEYSLQHCEKYSLLWWVFCVCLLRSCQAFLDNQIWWSLEERNVWDYMVNMPIDAIWEVMFSNHLEVPLLLLLCVCMHTHAFSISLWLSLEWIKVTWLYIHFCFWKSRQLLTAARHRPKLGSDAPSHRQKRQG